MRYNIHDILLVESTLRRYIPEYFAQRETTVTNLDESCDLVIHHLKDMPPSLIELASCTYRDFSGNLVVYSTCVGGMHVAWSLRNLEKKTTELAVSRGYRIWSKLIRIPVGGILPLEIYIKVILHLKLLSKGYAFIIAGCVIPEGNDNAILVCAPNAMGKTSVVMEMVRKRKAKLVADDTVIVDSRKNNVLSYPQPIRIRSRLNFDLLPFAEKHLAPESIFNVNYSTKVGTIFFLERAPTDSIEEISHQRAAARLGAINRKILSYQSENTVIWYTGCNPSVGLESLIEKEQKILWEFLRGKRLFVIRYGGSPYCAADLLKRTLHGD